MKLLKPLPPGRSYEQLMNHYMVEKSLAEKLKRSSREERKDILATMYDELFEKVPDHPRLTKRQSEELTLQANKSKLSIVDSLLGNETIFLEFAPGDCRFSFDVAKRVRQAYGVDISDQRNPADNVPDNFRLVIYDGYNLEDIESNSIDIVYSDQLIEHFHVEDTELHFELVHRILKKGGKYVFRTPHFLTGPHDISQYFSYEPECFHIKEWTYTEMKKMLVGHGYSRFYTFWNAKGINFRMPYYYFYISELLLAKIHKKHIRRATRYLIPTLCGVAVK